MADLHKLRGRIFQRDGGSYGANVVQWPWMNVIATCSHQHRTSRAANRCAQHMRLQCEYAATERDGMRRRALSPVLPLPRPSNPEEGE